MAVTLKQVAERAGLSLQTVSQCLRENSPKSHLYRPATRKRVLRVAAELGYRPNAVARAMAQRRFGLATLVLGVDPVRSTVFESMLFGLHDELAIHDMQLVVARLPDQRLSDPREMSRILRDRCSDGLLINYTDNIPVSMIDTITEERLPAIWINSRQENDSVYPDEFDAGLRASRHLLALGHRRIAFADLTHGEAYPMPHYSSRERRAGYTEAMRLAGLPTRVIWGDELDCIPPSRRVDRLRAELSVSQRPTAIITYKANDAIVCFTAAASLGLQVPRDLSLLTFGDKQVNFLGPRLTTMRLPEEQMGRTAVQMLVARITDPQVSLPRKPLPLDLEDGDSCGPVPQGV